MSKKGSGGSSKRGGFNYRSAKTGRFVTKRYADRNPDTTVREKK